MAENRDFLAEFEQLRVETDGIRDALVSKTGHFPNFSLGKWMSEMMGELKEMRKEIKENQEKNDKKFAVLTLELKKEIAEQNLKTQQQVEENEKKFEELRKEVLKLPEKEEKPEENPAILENYGKSARKVRFLSAEIPIREAVLGEWKMVDCVNWYEVSWFFNNKIGEFSQNLKFELIDGILKRSGAGHADLVEEEEDVEGRKYLYVENNHLKSIWWEDETDEIYIENGQLHYRQQHYDDSWMRIYEKVR